MRNKMQLLLLALLCFSSKINAQFTGSSIVTDDALINLVEDLDLNLVSSGILLDKGFKLAPINNYTGTQGSSVSNYTLFKGTFLSLHSAQLSQQLPEVNDALAPVEYTEGEPIPLAIIHVRAHQLKPNAIDNGEVTFSNGKLYNVPGKNPFEEIEVFSISPTVNNITGMNVEFTLPNQNIFSNIVSTSGAQVQAPISSLQINADDGQGFRQAILNPVNGQQAIAAPYTVNYTSTGPKTIEFMVSFEGDETEYYGASQLTINPAQVPVESDFTLKFPATEEHSGGTANVQFGCGSRRLIIKPLIIAEGFDPFNNNDANDWFFDKLSIRIDGNPLSSLLRNDGYDLVYVNYANGTDDIRRNAAFLSQVIDSLNTLKSLNGGAANKNVVIG